MFISQKQWFSQFSAHVAKITMKYLPNLNIVNFLISPSHKKNHFLGTKQLHRSVAQAHCNETFARVG